MLLVVSAKCYWDETMNGGIGSARNTRIVYRILVVRSWRDQLKDLSVCESALLKEGRNEWQVTDWNGAFGVAWDRWVVEIVTSLQVLELYWMSWVAELMWVCQERRSVDLVIVSRLLACWLLWLGFLVDCFVG